MSDTPSSGGGLFGSLSEKINQVDSSKQKPTMNLAELLELPDEQRKVVRHLLRADTPPTPAEAADALGFTTEKMAALVGQLTLIGLVEVTNDRLRAVAGWRSSRLPPGGVWSTLGNL